MVAHPGCAAVDVEQQVGREGVSEPRRCGRIPGHAGVEIIEERRQMGPLQVGPVISALKPYHPSPELIVAAGLATGNAAADPVTAQVVFGNWSLRIEVVLSSPAAAGIGADIAACPTQDRRRWRDRCLDRKVGGHRRPKTKNRYKNRD